MLIDAIDRLLPQTQCERCSYPGCRPYAEAILNEGAPINRCAPGGVKTMQAIAKFLNRPEEALTSEQTDVCDLPKKLAVIDEAKCIGCTLCIQACPVDSIIGAPKQMHIVLIDECTGCELCIAPCPMDCITLIPTDPPLPTWTVGENESLQQKADHARERFIARNNRLKHKAEPKKPDTTTIPVVLSDLEASIARAKEKRKQLGWGIKPNDA